MKEKILIVDDEKDIVRMLEYNLGKEGYRCLVAHDGEAALEKARRDHPDLVLLDLMLPRIDGLEVCKALKSDASTSAIPVIMLTAKTREADKVVGLELGADDYMTKPFSPRELLARIKAVLRRTHPQESSSVIRIGGLAVDTGKYTVAVKGKPVELTSKEFELLRTLINAKGRALSRDHLLDSIWGYDNAVEIQTRTVDVHINGLRRKLKEEGKRILTVKNIGYRFDW